jgi:hypothetical protein
MSADRSEHGRSLTGVWEGIYSYPLHGMPPVAFTATLFELGNALSGSVSEPCTAGPSGTLDFSLSGDRSGNALAFVKTYHGPNLRYRHPIHYEGIVNEDATEVEGTWTIPGNWSGRFLMVRSGGQPSAAAESTGVRRGLETVGRER